MPQVLSLVQGGYTANALMLVCAAAAVSIGHRARVVVCDGFQWLVVCEADSIGSGQVLEGPISALSDLEMEQTKGKRLPVVASGRTIATLLIEGEEDESFYRQDISDLLIPFSLAALAHVNEWQRVTIVRQREERRFSDEEGQRVESALRESELRFRRMAESTQDVIWISELAPERVLYVSPSFERIWGYKPDELYGNPQLWVQGICAGDRERVKASFDSWISDSLAAPWMAEFRVVHPSGSVRWILDRGAKSVTGPGIRISGISTDITERRLAEQALEASQERFALAMHAARDGHWDWVMSTDEFYASERMLEIYGFPSGHRFAGRDDFLRQFPFGPGERERWQSEFADYLRGNDTHFELTLSMLREGKVCYAHLHGLVSRDAVGKPIRWTGSVRDVTEQHAREVALKLSEERFALAVAASNDGIWDWDASSGQTFLSERARRLFGLTADAPGGAREQWLSAIRWHPTDAEKDDPAHRMASYLDGRLPTFDGEWRVRQVDGEYRWIRIRGQCVRDPAGHPLRMAGAVSDIDARRRTETALRQAQRLEAVGTLAGGIAHDFNNILGAILGFVELGLADTRAGSRARRDIELMGQAAERGRTLVERILAFSRAGRSESVPVSVDAVVTDAIQLLTPTVPAGVTVEMTLDASEATVLCDPTQLHQVAMNLLTNAVQAMPHAGRLFVGTRKCHLADILLATTGDLLPGEYVSLTVGDTGVGIAPTVLPRIFDPFFSTKEVGIGAGLGLSLVHGIVSEHGGAVKVETQPQQGSQFIVYLRRGADEQPVAISQRPPHSAGKARSVLVVDDDDLMLRVMVDAFARAGFTPTGFGSAREALEVFAAKPESFDAVVTDGRMPGMSGKALIAALRQHRPHVPVVLITAYVESTHLDPSEEHGADAVLRKPTTLRQLVDEVTRLLLDRGTKGRGRPS